RAQSNSVCRPDLKMVSHRQARVWRYVEDCNLLKLKSYLRKHPDLDVNFSQGKMRRSPLQLACSLEDDAVMRLLLKRGADVLHRDRRGNTALHIAANMAFDLFVPLKKKCPEALNTPNKAGLTPQDVSSSKRKKEKRKQKVESTKELHERLQREHEEYLARAARKEEEIRRGKKRQYDEKCAATFSTAASTSAGTKLSYGDIPWPAPRGTVREMLDVMLHGVDRKDQAAFRKALRKQQTLWHPDKFAQRCEARLEEKDKKRILDTVTALSQELNSLAQSLKA
uniref:NF-kappa-B inhibitor-like protein 1 n=1 Tax=Poecilia mexicana TaxID=48701 RepID=A0A3B3X9B5_9TELE